MRSAAQIVAYEIAMGFALVGVLMAAGSLNLGEIVAGAGGRLLSWNWFWLFPLFVVYFISGVAETNRAPFDVAEGESEIVAGFHVEYSGIGVRAVLPGRIRQHDPDLGADRDVLLRRLAEPVRGPDLPRAACRSSAAGWRRASTGCSLKLVLLPVLFLWFRATFPRYRYDQIMRLGWKILIPVTIVWIAVEGVMVYSRSGPGRREVSLNMRNIIKTFFLLGAAAGPARSRCAKFFTREGHDQLPGREDAAVAALPRPACAAPLSERRRALHRLQAVRGGVPGAGDHHRVGRRRGRHAPHHALRHRPVQVHLLRLLRGSLPGGCHRRDAHPRVPHGESRREHHDQGQAARRGRALRSDDRGRQGR